MKTKPAFTLTVRKSDEVRVVVIDGLDVKSVSVPKKMNRIVIKRGKMK